MADLYSWNTSGAPGTFADSIFGTASQYAQKNLVPIAVDKMYHKEVQTKTFFNRVGMISGDTYQEGNAEVTVAGVPVIRKTDLTANAGDAIRMALRKNLGAGVNSGRVGSQQLVTYEQPFQFDDMLVKIGQWREGVATYGGINAQRYPFGTYAELEMSLLSDWSAQTQDTGILYALHYGFAPHLYRAYGAGTTVNSTSTLWCTKIKNYLIGNDKNFDTTRTVADIVGDGSMNLSAATFEVGETYCLQNKFDPISVNGQAFWVALVSAKGLLCLKQDATFRNAMQYAMQRGIDNPLFKTPDALLYSNTLIFSYEKVREIIAGKNPAGLSVSSNTITEADYTGIGGSVTASQLHQTYFLGANAIALAEGRFGMAEHIRSENDYNNIIGRAVDNTWGAARCDYVQSGGSTIDANQSALNIVNTLIF